MWRRVWATWWAWYACGSGRRPGRTGGWKAPLLHHSVVVVTEGESFRMKQARNIKPDEHVSVALWNSY
ncbi:hypothetical protein [Nonomuraea angiospora]